MRRPTGTVKRRVPRTQCSQRRSAPLRGGADHCLATRPDHPDPSSRSLDQIPWPDLLTRSLGQTSWPDLLARPLGQTSWLDLLARPLGQTSWPDLLARPLGQAQIAWRLSSRGLERGRGSSCGGAAAAGAAAWAGALGYARDSRALGSPGTIGHPRGAVFHRWRTGQTLAADRAGGRSLLQGDLARNRRKSGQRANSSRARFTPRKLSCAVRFGRGELGLLLRARLLLVLGLPFLVRHAVNDLARPILA